MTTMNISLSPSLKDFVDEQVAGGAYVSTSEYVRDLIRQEQDRQKLRALLIGGLESPLHPVEPDYFEKLRERIINRKA